MRFCEAMTREMVDVTVVSLNVHLDFDEPTRTRTLEDVYGIADPFRVVILPSFGSQVRPRERASALWRAIVYATYAGGQLLTRRRHGPAGLTALYVKNYLAAVPLVALRRLFSGSSLVVFEMHVLLWGTRSPDFPAFRRHHPGELHPQRRTGRPLCCTARGAPCRTPGGRPLLR